MGTMNHLRDHNGRILNRLVFHLQWSKFWLEFLLENHLSTHITNGQRELISLSGFAAFLVH